MRFVKGILFSRSAILRVLISIWTLASYAQTPTGQITGRITDSSGAVIPGAQVTVTNVDTLIKREMPSNTVGYYVIPLLPPGGYRIDVQKQGFESVTERGVVLTVGQVARVDITLQVGAVTQKEEVTAEAPLLATDTAAIGTLVDSKRVQELPLSGRNAYALAELIPGVRFALAWQSLPIDMNSDQVIMINGARGQQNEYLLDGIPNNNARTGGPNLFPSPDSVQEFTVQTNSFNAEYGKSAGGVFNVVTKSGTNKVHGSAWEYNRVAKLDANNFFSNSAGSPNLPLVFNQFGATIGGPIRKDKTFFFGSWESARQNQGVIYLGQMPTAAQRSGDFSGTYNGAGQLVTVYDPLTSQANPNASGQYVRTPFPGNVIPQNRQNPTSLALQNYLPLPNLAGAPYTGANNFISETSTISNKDVYMIKVDHHFSAKNQVTGSYSYDRSPILRSNAFGNIATPTSGPQLFKRHGVVAEDTYLLSPTTILSFRYGLSRTLNDRTPYSSGFDGTKLGLPASYTSQLAYQAFPNIIVTGFANSFGQGNGDLMGASDLIRSGFDTHSANASITMVRGKHNFKAGFEFWLNRLDDYINGSYQNLFTAGVGFTQGPNPVVATSSGGYGYATFLLGIVSGTTNLVPGIAAQDIYYGEYFQDTFRILPKLTLNYGLRYDYQAPRTDRYNQLTNFNYNGAVPLTAPGLNLQGVLEFPGTGGLSRGASVPDRNNWAPRLGLSYQLTPKTVLRGGAGVFYSSADILADSGGLSGFSSTNTEVTSLDGLTPYTYINNPFPQSLAVPTGNKLGSATLLGQSISFTDRHHPTPYAMEWNVDVQHEFPGLLLLDIAYVGNRGVKLEDDANSRQFNQLPDSDLALGNQLLTQVANPFYGQISTGTLAQPTVTRGQLLLPYPQFTGVAATNMAWGESTYHAMQVKAEKRFAKGFTYMVTYTYSKLIDDLVPWFPGEALGGTGYQDWYDLKAERGISPADQTHNLVISYVWQLPFGPGQRYLSQMRGVLARFVEGWHIQGITTFQSGSPLGISTQTNTTDSYGGGQRANWTGVSPRLSNRTVNEWFDTSQFSQPAPYTFGNAPRTMGGLRSDGTKNFDFGAAKNIRVREGQQIEFRAEFFNLFNTPRFGIPGQAYGAATFGVVSSTLNQPRLTQLALKYIF